MFCKIIYNVYLNVYMFESRTFTITPILPLSLSLPSTQRQWHPRLYHCGSFSFHPLCFIWIVVVCIFVYGFFHSLSLRLPHIVWICFLLLLKSTTGPIMWIYLWLVVTLVFSYWDEAAVKNLFIQQMELLLELMNLF